MGCEMDTPYCDECHAKFIDDPKGFVLCDECRKALENFCWVCMSNGKNVEQGACEECRK